jgi:hypothetical protein
MPIIPITIFLVGVGLTFLVHQHQLRWIDRAPWEAVDSWRNHAFLAASLVPLQVGIAVSVLMLLA